MRLIIYSREDGSQQGVVFTDDLYAPVEDFIPYPCACVHDGELKVTLPIEFPMEDNLERV